MSRLTIKDLLNKILNFDLYSLKKYTRHFIYISLSIVVVYGLFISSVKIKTSIDTSNIKTREVEVLASAKLHYKNSKKCFDNLSNTTFTREDLEFYLTYEECIKERDLTKHEIKILQINWSDPTSNLYNFQRSSFYKLGPKPVRCWHNGRTGTSSGINCNNGSYHPL